MQGDGFTALDSEETEKKKKSKPMGFFLISWNPKALGWSHLSLKQPSSYH